MTTSQLKVRSWMKRNLQSKDLPLFLKMLELALDIGPRQIITTLCSLSIVTGERTYGD